MSNNVGGIEPIEIAADYMPLRERVRDIVRQRIIDGLYPPGSRLIESELATQLSVSRVPIREALRALESEGFVRPSPNRGVEVAELSVKDIDELFDVREALEMLASRNAAERATQPDLQRVARALSQAREALENEDTVALGAANEAFHDEIIKLAHNDLLITVLEPLQGRLHWLLRQIADPKDLLDEHTRLFEAIATGDPELAAERAQRHARRNREIVLELVQQRHRNVTSA